jgi:nitroreductase
MDAGHLSQTLQLVCTDLGLGAFVTAAINAANVDERLGIDGFEEGAIAACGFGVAAAPDPLLEPDFAPFEPRRTSF